MRLRLVLQRVHGDAGWKLKSACALLARVLNANAPLCCQEGSVNQLAHGSCQGCCTGYPDASESPPNGCRDRALALAERLLGDGNLALGSRLRETVPETFSTCDEHVPLLRAALVSVGQLPDFATDSRKIINALVSRVGGDFTVVG